MNQFINTSRSNLIKNRFILANSILISLMVTTIAFTVMQLIHFFLPNWIGGYLPIIAFLAAVEAILSHRVLTEVAVFSKQWFLHITFEWFLILLVVKIVIFMQGSFTQFLQEISLLGNDFFKQFFTLEYTIAIICTSIFWFIAIILSDSIKQLEEDKDLMDQEKLGFTINDRTIARKRMINITFSIGTIQLIITAMLNNNFSDLPNPNTTTRYFIIALICYFLFSFMLLALNQYNLQKARWYLSDIPVSDSVPRLWLKYCIVLISLVTLSVLFLPTSFIQGVFPIFWVIADIFVFLFQLVQAILFVPLMVLMKLFSNEPSSEIIQKPIEQSVPLDTLDQIIPTLNVEVSWWTIVRSILFWVVFIAILYFSLTFFIRQNKEWFSKHRMNFVRKWFYKLWLDLKNLFKKAKRVSQETINSGLDRIRLFFSKTSAHSLSTPEFFKSLSPRIGTILRYIAIIHWLSKNNYPTQPTKTPAEFALYLTNKFPQLDQTINSITALFIKARYSKSSITHLEYKNFVTQISILKSEIKS